MESLKNDASHADSPETADVRFGTIPRLAQFAGETWPEDVAVIDGEISLTFAEIAQQAKQVTASLLAQGIKPGDRIGLWAPNSATWIIAALGIQGAQAWLLPLNTRFKPDEVAYALNKTDAAALVVADEFMGSVSVADLRAEFPDLRALNHVIDLPHPGVITTPAWEEFLEAGSASLDAAEASIAAGSADDISDIIFTSGTTGRPKGVLLRHGTSLRCYESFNTSYGSTHGDRHLISTPFFHCFGYKAGWMLAMMTGATTVPLAVFNTQNVLELIEKHGITHMPGAPTVFQSVLQEPTRTNYDLSSLRVSIVAAASISASLIHEMHDTLAFKTIMSGYGLTENHALGTFTHPDDPLSAVSETVGRPAPGITVRIIDNDGHDLPEGEEGEILLGGYAHMSGYYDDEAATNEVLRDGWLHTGDIGKVTPEGFVKITDRKKDMYIVGGFNVSPAEVESSLMKINGVAMAGVVGIPDERMGEVGMAFIVPAAGHTLTEETVIAESRKLMANYKVPRKVSIMDALPLNATGKILRTSLRNMALEDQKFLNQSAQGEKS